MPTGKRSKAVTELRQADVLAMVRENVVREGNPRFDEVAKEQNYASGSGAYKAFMAGLRKGMTEDAKEIQTISLARIEAMIEALWPFAMGDIDLVLQWYGKGRDRQPVLDDEGRQLAYVMPSKAMLDSIDQVRKLLERQSRYVGADFADGLMERQVQLQEAQASILAEVIKELLKRLDLTPEQQQRAPTIVREITTSVAS